MSNALFNSFSCCSGFQPQAGSELYGSRYGLRCGLPYGLRCGLPCGLLYALLDGLLHSLLRDLLRGLLCGLLYGLLRELLYGLLCSVRHAFPLLLPLTSAFNTDFSPRRGARAQRQAAIYLFGDGKRTRGACTRGAPRAESQYPMLQSPRII